MKAMKFKKKPVVIDAIQWTCDNAKDIQEFAGIQLSVQVPEPSQFEDDTEIPDYAYVVTIPTLGGLMNATKGDWIIRGTQGELYPCRNDIFLEIYEPVSWCSTETGKASVNVDMEVNPSNS